ncbi:MAG TPA: exodeoxyribonuclease VII large subunit [Longimicrobiales bacterium]|nr:exodeoxyribonuclease VII large subunit [Longimicrobiales bacterium]
MSRPGAFHGDLFETTRPPARAGASRSGDPDALTVSALNALARNVLERGVGTVWVAGEVTGWKRYPSGHCYFTLRDAHAQMRCVMFRMEAQRLPADPGEGMRVRVLGALTIYEKKGDFQFVVRELEARDAGGLWKVAFEKLRAKLEAEGLLARERKRPLPLYPAAVGIVTSPVGAALQDMLHVIGRRAPWVRVVLSPARVQGRGAALDVARAIARVTRGPAVDVVIVGRGGGGIEDLWAFNEEPVARAIVACPVPVISAVGHETDVTIADLVADFRAPTPSAAAECAVPDGEALSAQLLACYVRLRQALGRGAVRQRQQVARLHADLERCMRARAADASGHTRELGAALEDAVAARVRHTRDRLRRIAGTLDALSPLAVLQRGYAVAQDEQGRVLRRTGDLPAGRSFRLRLGDGTVAAESAGPLPAREEP